MMHKYTKLKKTSKFTEYERNQRKLEYVFSTSKNNSSFFNFIPSNQNSSSKVLFPSKNIQAATLK